MRRKTAAIVIALAALLGIGAAAAASTGGHVAASAPRTHYYDLATVTLLADDAGT